MSVDEELVLAANTGCKNFGQIFFRKLANSRERERERERERVVKPQAVCARAKLWENSNVLKFIFINTKLYQKNKCFKGGDSYQNQRMTATLINHQCLNID